MRINELVPAKANASAEIRGLAAKAVTFKFADLVKLIRYDEYLGDETGALTVRDVTQHYLVPFVRFMMLKAQAEDVDAKILSPTENIDRVWHLMLQFPVQYAAFCDLLLPATQKKRVIDHRPTDSLVSLGGAAAGARTRRLHNMQDAYFREFGSRPDEIWLKDKKKKKEDPRSDALQTDGKVRKPTAVRKVLVRKPIARCSRRACGTNGRKC